MRTDHKVGGRGVPALKSKLWVATHTGLKVKPWVATHTGLKRRLSPRLLRISGSFTARYRSLAMFQLARRQAGNLAAARFLRFGIAASGLQPLTQQDF
jgi:hypothetical protein